MSSEMRELLAKYEKRLANWTREHDQCATEWAYAHRRQCSDIVDDLRALLARTEAGADGAAPFGWWIECHGSDGDFGQFVTDRAFVELLRSHGVVERETALFTRPQDASGDAVTEADIVALVAGPYKYHHKMDEQAEREGKAFDRCRELTIQKVQTFFAMRAAMQAKEAK